MSLADFEPKAFQDTWIAAASSDVVVAVVVVALAFVDGIVAVHTHAIRTGRWTRQLSAFDTDSESEHTHTHTHPCSTYIETLGPEFLCVHMHTHIHHTSTERLCACDFMPWTWTGTTAYFTCSETILLVCAETDVCCVCCATFFFFGIYLYWSAFGVHGQYTAIIPPFFLWWRLCRMRLHDATGTVRCTLTCIVAGNRAYLTTTNVCTFVPVSLCLSSNRVSAHSCSELMKSNARRVLITHTHTQTWSPAHKQLNLTTIIKLLHSNDDDDLRKERGEEKKRRER